jgi:hypothetical protein
MDVAVELNLMCRVLGFEALKQSMDVAVELNLMCRVLGFEALKQSIGLWQFCWT